MRLLIAQGPGYYGVNIRAIDEATYERLLAKDEYAWEGDNADGSCDGMTAVMAQVNGTTMVMTEHISEFSAADGPQFENHSVGFDTGWWEQGEAAIEEVLK